VSIATTATMSSTPRVSKAPCEESIKLRNRKRVKTQKHSDGHKFRSSSEFIHTYEIADTGMHQDAVAVEHNKSQLISNMKGSLIGVLSADNGTAQSQTQIDQDHGIDKTSSILSEVLLPTCAKSDLLDDAGVPGKISNLIDLDYWPKYQKDNEIGKLGVANCGTLTVFQ